MRANERLLRPLWEKFAGGCSINARITAFPGALLNPAVVVAQKLLLNEPLRYLRLTKEGDRVVAVLDGLMVTTTSTRATLSRTTSTSGSCVETERPHSVRTS